MLTPQQIAQFHHDGFLVGDKLLSDEQVERLRADLKTVLDNRDRKDVKQPVLLRNLKGGDVDPIWQIVNIWEASEAFHDLIYVKRACEEVGQLTSAQQLRVWHDQIQYKPASKGGINMWHQDWPLWDLLSQPAQVTAWYALDDVDTDNGCMSMVVGSHQWGDQMMKVLANIKEFDQIPKEWNGHKIEVKLCPVKKGHVHYHHGLTWHGSHANTSDRPRRAIAIHYMTENTCFLPGGHPMVQFAGHIARGQMIQGDHFPLVWERKSA